MPRLRSVRIPLATAALLAQLTAPTPAHCQQESVAEALFRQAREEMKRGEVAAACPKFEESYRLDPSSGTLLNLALCEDALGHTATAWTKLRQFLDSAPAEDSRTGLARTKITQLETLLPRLRLVVEQEDAVLVVQLDDVELREASLSQPIPVNPGEHVVRVTRATGEAQETPFRIQPAEVLDLRVSAPPRSPSEPPLAPTPTWVQPTAASVAVATAHPSTSSTDRSGERTAGYAAGAIGIAGLVTGSVFGLMAIHDRSVVHDNCPNHECQDQTGLDAAESGARNETAANVAFTVGALGLLTGGLLLWHSGRTTAAVSVGSNSASIFWVGSLQ